MKNRNLIKYITLLGAIVKGTPGSASLLLIHYKQEQPVKAVRIQ